MKIDVYDSYAKSKGGKLLHFDVFVESGTSAHTALAYGREWLQSIDETAENLESSRCNFCHSRMADPDVQSAIKECGYYILQMEGCPEPV